MDWLGIVWYSQRIVYYFTGTRVRDCNSSRGCVAHSFVGRAACFYTMSCAWLGEGNKPYKAIP